MPVNPRRPLNKNVDECNRLRHSARTMSKIILHLQQGLRVGCPDSVEVDDERIACNNVTLPGDFNPHNTKLYVIGNEYGALGAVWADNLQDAFDALCDEGFSAGLSVEEPVSEHDEEEVSRLGNAGEPHDLSNAWAGEVIFEAARDLKVLLKFAEARGAGVPHLGRI